MKIGNRRKETGKGEKQKTEKNLNNLPVDNMS